MPFGLRMCQDIFQRKIYQTNENCKGAVGIPDDVQVFGKEKTHDRNLNEAIECTRKVGIKLNFDKCFIKTKCCCFCANLYTPEGVKPDPKKVETIKQMQPPINKQQLSSFLGMVTYLSQHMPNISSLTSDLRGLLKKDALFSHLRHMMYYSRRQKIQLERMSVLAILIPLKTYCRWILPK